MASISPLLLNNDDPRFQLNVENRLSNIFVTQLEDCSNLQTINLKEHDKNVNHIPVITESSNRILKTSANTLQRTLVLKTQVQVDEGDRLLQQKRLEFKDRMQNLEQKRAALLQKQEEIKERAAKFEKFVEENEAKRCRAMKKYQVERKLNVLKDKERSELLAQLKQLQIRHQNLKENVTKYKIYEEFMMKVLELLPENFLERGTDSVVMPIIRRHETLAISQQDLLQRLANLAEEMDQSQHNLESLKQKHSTQRLMINKDLAELQTQLDQIREKNKHLEMTLHMQQGQSRYQDEETGILLIAVKNIGQQCHMKHYRPLEAMNMLNIMDMIKEFILDKADTERRVLKMTDSSSEQTKRSQDRGRKGPSLNSNSSSIVYLKSSSKSSGGSKLISSSKTMQ